MTHHGTESSGLISADRAAGAYARTQDATPAPARPPIGNPRIPHVSGSDRGTVAIYSSWPLTGSNEQLGNDMAEAVLLAIEWFGNEAGGFAVRYTAMNDGNDLYPGSWDAEIEEMNAQQALADPECVAYLGPYHATAAEIVIPLLSRPNPPLAVVSPAATAGWLTRAVAGVSDTNQPNRYYPTGERNFVRTAPIDGLQSRVAADYAYGERAVRWAYVLHDATSYGLSVATAFRDRFAELGGEIAGFGSHSANIDSYLPLADEVAATMPDAVYLGSIATPGVGRLIRDLRARLMDANVLLIGPDGLMNAPVIANAEGRTEGVVATSLALPAGRIAAATDAGAAWFADMVERLDGREPHPYSAFAFEAAVVVLQALDAVQTADRQTVLNAIRVTSGFEGLTNTWSVDSEGDRDASPIALHVIANGQFVFETTIEGRG